MEEIYVFVTGRTSRKTRDSWLFEWSTWSGTPPKKNGDFFRASQIFSNDSLPGCTWECGHLRSKNAMMVFYWYDLHITYIKYKYYIYLISTGATLQVFNLQLCIFHIPLSVSWLLVACRQFGASPVAEWTFSPNWIAIFFLPSFNKTPKKESLELQQIP